MDLNRQFGMIDESASDEPQASASQQETVISAVDAIGATDTESNNVNAVIAKKSQPDEAFVDVHSDGLIVTVDEKTESDSGALKVFEDNLPEYDAANGETQSFGFFKIETGQPARTIPVNENVDSDALPTSKDASETLSANVVKVEDESAPLVPEFAVNNAEEINAVATTSDEPILSAKIEEPDEVVPAVVGVTETAATIESEESTEFWPRNTQRPYDGGSTVDDIVEVNAMPYTTELSTLNVTTLTNADR